MKPQAMRFNEIDLLRGIACLSVLAYHYVSRGPRANWMLGVNFPMVESIVRHGYLGVHLFFVISGFVILMSAQDATPRSFVASRVARLYPALWVGATLTAGTAWLLAESRFAVSLQDYLVNLTLTAHWFGVPYVDGAYWSLAYELHFYIYVWLALRLGLMNRLQWLLAAWLMVSFVNAVRPMWPVEFWLNAKWAPFFVAGGVFYLIRTQGASRARVALLAVSFALALVYSLRNVATQSLSRQDALFELGVVAAIVSAIFVVFWLIATNRFRMEASRLTFYAGALTYPVYVVHQFFGFMVFEQLRMAWNNVPLAMMTMIALVLAISWLIHVAVERPLGPRLRKALDRQPRLLPVSSSAGT